MWLVLCDEEGRQIRVGFGDFGKGPGLGRVLVSVEDSRGNKVVPEHAYHFDVRSPETIDLNRYAEEPEELPDLPAYLVVEPYFRPVGT
ncbi:MAG: hypothetical protein AB1816_00610 [Bacillota bacterium]